MIGLSETTLSLSGLLGAKLHSVKDEHFFVVQILEGLILTFTLFNQSKTENWNEDGTFYTKVGTWFWMKKYCCASFLSKLRILGN